MSFLISTSPNELRSMFYSWDEKAYKYKIVKSTMSSDELEELDEHVFVVRVRIDEYIDLYTAFVTDDVTP